MSSEISEISEKLAAALEDETKQGAFYECFLNALLYIPTWDKPEEGIVNMEDGVEISPVVMEDSELQFIMMFDTEERLTDWADEGIYYVAMTGAMILQTFGTQFHLLLNMGEERNKVFKPDELEWLLQYTAPAGQA